MEHNNRHNFQIIWDKESDSAMEKCSNCGLKKRKRYVWKEGLRKCIVGELLINGSWIIKGSKEMPCQK